MRAWQRALAILLLGLSLAGAGRADEVDKAARKFWGEFRSAVEADDRQRVAALTLFPFAVRGPSDGDPVRHYGRRHFLAVYQRLVTQPVYVTQGDRAVPTPMLVLVSGKDTLVAADFDSRDVFRVHQFEFRRVGGRWWWTRAYLEE